jgi:uncharacterized membrane-anchored protein
VPHSVDAERELAGIRESIACAAYSRARDHAWSAAAAAASIGDKEALATLLELVETLAEHGDVDQLRVYITEALKDAKEGTRPPSAFERLMQRDQRPR